MFQHNNVRFPMKLKEEPKFKQIVQEVEEHKRKGKEKDEAFDAKVDALNLETYGSKEKAELAQRTVLVIRDPLSLLKSEIEHMLRQ